MEEVGHACESTHQQHVLAHDFPRGALSLRPSQHLGLPVAVQAAALHRTVLVSFTRACPPALLLACLAPARLCSGWLGEADAEWCKASLLLTPPAPPPSLPPHAGHALFSVVPNCLPGLVKPQTHVHLRTFSLYTVQLS